METARELRAGHYFLAVEGLAMLRDFLHDPEGLVPRAREVERIVEEMGELPQSLAVPVVRYDVASGYTRWAPRYDGPNPAIQAEEPAVAELLQRISAPGRAALDAACGTGRHAATLADAGWEVLGVDATPAMLELARSKVPGGDFRLGELESLPIDDGSVDLVVCGLALTHVGDLRPVFAEFARVLAPGGQLITTDMHPTMTVLGGEAAFPVEPSGDAPFSVHYVANLVHHASEYLAAILGAGLHVRDCVEPKVTDEVVRAFPSFVVVPEATREAFVGLPYLLVWHAERPG